MVDLFRICLELFMFLFYYIVCDYFGLFKVKISWKIIIKYYGVIFICMNMRVVYLELVVDYFIVEFM